MDITSVIIRPVVTEKTQILRSGAVPKMTFLVNRMANRHQVAVAFESIFGIRPVKVNLLIRKPSPTRLLSRSSRNYTKAHKVAYVTVSHQQMLNLQREAEEQMVASQAEEMRAEVGEEVIAEALVEGASREPENVGSDPVKSGDGNKATHGKSSAKAKSKDVAGGSRGGAKKAVKPRPVKSDGN